MSPNIQPFDETIAVAVAEHPDRPKPGAFQRSNRRFGVALIFSGLKNCRQPRGGTLVENDDSSSGAKNATELAERPDIAGVPSGFTDPIVDDDNIE